VFSILQLAEDLEKMASGEAPLPSEASDEPSLSPPAASWEARGSEKGEVLLRGVLTLRYSSHTQPARLWKAACLHMICSWFDNPPPKVITGSRISRSASPFSQLRKITGVKAAYISRVTNEEVSGTASQGAGLKRGQELPTITKNDKY